MWTGRIRDVVVGGSFVGLAAVLVFAATRYWPGGIVWALVGYAILATVGAGMLLRAARVTGNGTVGGIVVMLSIAALVLGFYMAIFSVAGVWLFLAGVIAAPWGAALARLDLDRYRLRLRVAKALRAARLASQWSLTSLAAEVGISRGHLIRIQNGTRAPSSTVAMQLVEALDLDPEYGLGADLIRHSISGVGHDRWDTDPSSRSS